MKIAQFRAVLKASLGVIVSLSVCFALNACNLNETSVSITRSGSSAESTSALVIKAPISVLYPHSYAQFDITGGVPPYIMIPDPTLGSFQVIDKSDFAATALLLTLNTLPNSLLVVSVMDSLGTIASTIMVPSTDGSGGNGNLPLFLTGCPDPLAAGASCTLSATGGSGSGYSYSLVTGTGALNGDAYTAPIVASTEVFQVMDDAGDTASFTIHVSPPTLLVLSAQTNLVVVSGTLQFSVNGGIAPYIYSLTSGVGSINPDTGLYSAAAMSAGTDAVVKVSDASNQTASMNIHLVSGMDPSMASVTASSDSDGEDGAGVVSSTILATSSQDFGFCSYTLSIHMDRESYGGCTGSNHLMMGSDCWSTGDFGTAMFPAQAQKPTITFNFNGYYPLDTIRLVALRRLSHLVKKNTFDGCFDSTSDDLGTFFEPYFDYFPQNYEIKYKVGANWQSFGTYDTTYYRPDIEGEVRVSNPALGTIITNQISITINQLQDAVGTAHLRAKLKQMQPLWVGAHNSRTRFYSTAQGAQGALTVTPPSSNKALKSSFGQDEKVTALAGGIINLGMSGGSNHYSYQVLQGNGSSVSGGVLKASASASTGEMIQVTDQTYGVSVKLALTVVSSIGPRVSSISTNDALNFDMTAVSNVCNLVLGCAGYAQDFVTNYYSSGTHNPAGNLSELPPYLDFHLARNDASIGPSVVSHIEFGARGAGTATVRGFPVQYDVYARRLDGSGWVKIVDHGIDQPGADGILRINLSAPVMTSEVAFVGTTLGGDSYGNDHIFQLSKVTFDTFP